MTFNRVLRVVLFFILPLYSLQAQELYLLENNVGQGEVLTCYLWPADGLEETSFILEDNNGNVLASHPGFVYSPRPGVTILLSIFGIPSTAAEGVGTVTVRFHSQQSRQERSALVGISYRDFLEEVIVLDDKGSDILTTPDPRKKEQAKKLWAILLSWNPERIFAENVFALPVAKAEETSWYGDRRTFKYPGGGSSSSIHGGLDLAAPTGEPILAPEEGLVVMAEDRIVSGWTIVVEHLPGIFTLYYHLSSLDVAEGQNVKKGQLLGALGATGLVTGPHLHWEVKIHGVSVDPKWFLAHPLIDKEGILSTIDATVTKGR